MLGLLADIILSIYFGASHASPSDLHVVQSARGNNATFHDVAWRDYPSRAPIYYGVRLSYNAPGRPWAAIALDYTHLKVYADTQQNVAQDGIWNDERFSSASPMRDRVQSFEITHGVNLLGLVLVQQFSASRDNGFYFGAGPVIYLPHAESRVDGLPASTGYAYGGGGFEVFSGVRACVASRPIFAEAKYSHGAPYVAIAQGTAQTRVDARHILAGIAVQRCR